MNKIEQKRVRMFAGMEPEMMACQPCNPWATQLMMRVASKSRLCKLEPKHAVVRKCRCKGRNGMPKKLYESHSQAMYVAELRMGECNYKLYVYRCPNCDGWHLTKNPHRW